MADLLRDRLQSSLGDAYTLGRELASGALSRVFVAREEALGRDVVVKVLSPTIAEGLSAERFAREIRLAAALQEPHIVPLLAAGQTREGLPYYTMPFVQGESLRHRLSQGRPPLAESVSVLRDVARALAYAHRQGVVHRDVKPENVLISEGTAVVTDFGIAKALHLSQTDDGLGTLTRTGTAIGTPAYMAPEQAAGDVVDARADLYAWGVMAYELLAGAHPFAGRASAQHLIAAHLAETPTPLATRAPDVPPALAALVARTLEKDPARRPRSAEELVAVLDAAASEPAVAAAPRARRRRRRTLAGVALGALVAAGALALVRGVDRAGPSGGGSAAPPDAARPDAARTVVVVPFDNLGAAADEYFADGMTEEIAGRLARVPGLTVVGRASALGMRGSGRSPEEVARALGAGYVLRGSVRWARGARGDTAVRIAAALVRVSTGAEVWGEPYQATLTDVFRVQTDVAERVAAALQLRLADGAAPTGASPSAPQDSAAVPARLAARSAHAGDREAAVDAYLLGRHHWRKRGLTSLRRSLVELQRAIALDSSYAPAWALYADALAVAPTFGDTARAPADVRREGEAAARRAIALAPRDPRGWSALGMVLQFDYAFHDALAANDRALALDSSDATTLERRAEILLCLGRLPEAEAAARRAAALDPLAAINGHALALVMLGRGRTDEAIRYASRAVELEPQVPLFRLLQGIAFLGAGRLDEGNASLAAIGMLNDATRAINRGIVDPAHRAEGVAGVTAWRRAVPDRVSLHAGLAFWYAALGQADSALAMLERGAAVRDSGVPLMLTFYGFEPLRHDARWVAFVQRLRSG